MVGRWVWSPVIKRASGEIAAGYCRGAGQESCTRFDSQAGPATALVISSYRGS
jgi:hypothetical protein